MALTNKERESRKLSIGGSDIAAISGVSPHKTAFQLYLEKTNQFQEDEHEESDAQIWGNLLEEPIAQFYAKKHMVEISAFNQKLVHPEFPYITANPDRVILNLERLIEIKTTGAGGIRFWRDPEIPGSLRPPHHVVLQVNFYLGMLGWQEADIVLLQFCEGFSGPDRYIEFQVTFDKELFDLELEIARNFWINHVTVRIPPESEDPADVSQYLLHTYKQVTSDQILEATQEMDEIAARLDYAQKQAKHWENQRIIESNAMKAIIGSNAGIRGLQWLYTWKETNGSGVDWKALAQSKNPTDDELKKFSKNGYRRQYFKYQGKNGE